MLSVIRNNPRIRQLLSLMLMVLLPAFLLLAVALLMLTYHSTAKMVDDNINHQLQETGSLLQGRLDSYLSGLDSLLSTTAEQPELAAIIASDDRHAARIQLQNTLNHNHGEYLDLLILTRQGQYWTNMNSPLYILEHRLQTLIADTPFYNKWAGVELTPLPAPLTALIQRYPVLSPDSGQMIGSLFGGLVLNDNLTLLSLLGQDTQNINLQLVLRGKPVGPSLTNSDVSADMFTRALSSQRPRGRVQGHYFSLQPLLINGEQSELQLLLLTDDTLFQQLRQTYGYHSLQALILVLMITLALTLYTLKRLTSPLNGLGRSVGQAGHGHPGSSQAGHIEELKLPGPRLQQADTSRHLHGNILENMMEAVVMFDSAHRLIYANPAYTHITGHRLDEVIGMTLSSVLRITLGDQAWQRPWQRVGVTGYWQGEVASRLKNRRPGHLWLSISALQDRDGETSHYMVVFSDISTLKDSREQPRDTTTPEAAGRPTPLPSPKTGT
ncbi:LuxQ periplasmic sensor domain-containing protein [Oceanisphaera psychrotolerans]|nr:LuxQ periplasmic sensor domain-containing protein [Oceanisphaera psychrotolerans]